MKKILILIAIYFLLTGISWGDMGHSQEGKGAEVTLTHTSELDSAWVIFTCNGSRYDSIKVTPLFGSSSRFLAATDLDLDSLCKHAVEIRMYSGGSWTDTLTGGWLHENPNLVSSDNIGINWADVSNPTSTVGLTNTTLGTVTNLTTWDKSGYSLSSAGITAVWEENISAYSGAGYAGTYVKNLYDNQGNWLTATGFATHSAADAADAVWDEVQGGHTGQGTFGKFVDTTITSRGTAGATWSANQRDSVMVALYAATKDSVLVSVILEMLLLIKDTIDAQGSGGATDTTLIKTVAGNNPQIWTDQSSGSGSEQETLIVLDGDDNAIEGAKISIWNSSGTPYANNITDANGKHVFYLDVDTYIIGTRRVGIHSSTDTLVITADGTDTIDVVAFSPASPPEDSMCAVYGYIKNKDGTDCESCLVVIDIDELYHPVKYHGQFIIWFPDTVYTDSTGKWEKSLYWTSVLDPDSTKYVISQINPYSKSIYEETEVEVPDSSQWWYGL